MIKNNNFLLFNDSLVLGYYFFCNYKEKNIKKKCSSNYRKMSKKSF